MLINKIYITDPDNLIYANIDSVNAYFERQLHADDILPDALYSYYVDYYRSQVQTGGIAQFAHNTGWHSGILHYVEHGLHTMGTDNHLNLLEKTADTIMQDIGVDNFIQFTQQKLSDKNPIYEKFNQLTAEFAQINQQQNLETINHNFLKNHPDLTLINTTEFKQILSNLTQNPDIQNRLQQHFAQLLPHHQAILKLCEQYDCELLHILDKIDNENGDENWHFFTSRGRFFLQETENARQMLTYRNPTVVATIPK